MKKTALLCVLAVLCLNIQAQVSTWIPEQMPDSCYLNIGKTVPDITLYPLQPHTKATRLSAYKTRLIILDFWSIYCAPCIRAFPKMDSLQKMYPKDLKILLVNTNYTPQNAAKADSLIHVYEKKINQKIDLPALYMDIPTTALFFYMVTVPHYIWLNDRLQIIATTGPEEVNHGNIQALLSGKKIQMVMKPANTDKVEHTAAIKQFVSLKPLQ